MLTHPAVEVPNPKRYILVMGGGQDLEQDLLSMYPDILDAKRVCTRASGYMATCLIFMGLCVFGAQTLCLALTHASLCFVIINIICRGFLCVQFCIAVICNKAISFPLVADKHETLIPPNSCFNLA